MYYKLQFSFIHFMYILSPDVETQVVHINSKTDGNLNS